MKKIKAFINKHFPRVYKPTGKPGRYEILNINPDTGDIRDSLGIDHERAQEIKEACCNAMENSKDVVETMEKVSKSLLHQNELAYAIWEITHRFRDMNSPANIIMGILGGGGKRK